MIRLELSVGDLVYSDYDKCMGLVCGENRILGRDYVKVLFLCAKRCRKVYIEKVTITNIKSQFCVWKLNDET